VIFVGLDGGDWQLLDRYIAAGTMPNLAALKREGSSGILRTIHPPLSPIVWTSMMTGVDPLDHRILDFTRFNPLSGQREPITSDERRAPAIWNMCSYEHKRAAVIGMWATFPAEQIEGTMISDRLFSFQFAEEQIPDGALWPASLRTSAADALLKAGQQISLATMRVYLPDLSENEFRELSEKSGYSSLAGGLRRILVETMAYHHLALDALRRDRPDLTIVYLQGTDAIGHLFAPYSPPRQAVVSSSDFAHYGNVASRYFSLIDGLLGEYREEARRTGATLVLASDHGFHWIDDRPSGVTSANSATAARWHRDEGLYLIWRGGQHGTQNSPAGSAPQICSTLLELSGLPPDRALAAPLPAAAPFTQTRLETPVSYQRMFRKSFLAGRAPVVAVVAPAAADREAIEKLKGLGYIDGREAQITAKHGSTRTAGSFSNEGLILREKGRLPEAEAAFREALAIDPDSISSNWNLSQLLASQGKREESDRFLLTALRRGYPDAVAEVVRRALSDSAGHDKARADGLVAKALDSQPENPALLLLRGKSQLERNECGKAAADFRKAEELDPRNAIAAASRALAALCLGDRGTAAAELKRSLELDPDQPQLREYLRQLR